MEQLFNSFQYLFQFWKLSLLFIGSISWYCCRIDPGLTTTMLITLTLPLTFFMDSVNAITLLIGMYVGGISGSQIAATYCECQEHQLRS